MNKIVDTLATIILAIATTIARIVWALIVGSLVYFGSLLIQAVFEKSQRN